MPKIRLVTVAAALSLACVAGWVATTTHAQAPVRSEGINPSEITMSAKNLPVEEFVDYSFVFN
jgi:alkylhydroperoxidase/carboxymuconolactone decarboxylase family protein YurZ